MDLDVAYENGAFIPDGAKYPDKWQAAAHSWREVEHSLGRARLNIAYGNAARQQLDLFYPAGKPNGLVVFIHGGYWRGLDRKMWSHLSKGVTTRGWAMAIPSYTLAPEARISEITDEIAAAVGFAATQVDGGVVITGHSAGGHLSARMMCRDVDLPAGVEARLKRSVPISPLSDLTPLMGTKMNEDLRLDEAEVILESPINCTALRSGEVTVWVGAEERPAFLDQARWLTQAWEHAKLRVAPGRHHFDVIEELEQPESPLTNTLLEGL